MKIGEKRVNVWTLLLVVMVCQWASSCTVKNPPLEVSVQGTKDKKTKAYAYRGGLMKFWVSLEEPVADIAQVRWKTGKADIAIRRSGTQNGLIVADTVYLHWETLPRATLILDTTRLSSSAKAGSSASAGSGSSIKIDTTLRYFDSIGVVVNQVESAVEVVEILNILPRIDRMSVGGLFQVGDSLLTLAAHPGERMDVVLFFKDAFNLNYPVQEIAWPSGIGNLITISRNDTAWSWSWNAPNQLLDTTLRLVLTDKGGFGEREYRLQVIIYDESGSAWVASGSELVKFSPGGSEVARVAGDFREISDMILNSNTTIQNKLYVLDIGKHTVHYYDAYGRLIRRDTSNFVSPMSGGVDVESRLLWIADLARISGDTLFSRLRRFSLSQNGNWIAVGDSFVVPGPLKSLSVDQFERDLVWFASPEEDFVGYVRSGSTQVRMFRDTTYRFNRPGMVSYDPVGGLAWIADSSRVLVMDTAGQVRATISGFSFANALSSAGGVCWVSDIMAGKVYRFSRSVQGRLTVSSGLSVDGFIAPASVSAYAADQGVWVADKGAGQVVRLNGSGERIATGSGLTLPHLIRVHQVIE